MRMGWLRLSENPSTFSITLEINVRMRTGPGMAFTDDTLTPGRFGTEHARSKTTPSSTFEALPFAET